MSIERRVGAVVACGAAFAAILFMAGCPGTLSDPQDFADATGSSVDSGTLDVTTGDTSAADVVVEAAPPCPDTPTVIAAQCATAGCHTTLSPAQDLDLQSSGIFSRLLGKMSTETTGNLIDPGKDPTKSVLYEKLLASPPSGGRMPPGTPLDDAGIACFGAWIAAGGPGGAATDAAAE